MIIRPVHFSREAPGVYRVDGALFSTRFLILHELDPGHHLWLANLCSGLTESRLHEIMKNAGSVSSGEAQNQKKQRLINSVIDVIMKGNMALMIKLLKGQNTMLVKYLAKCFDMYRT